MKNQFYFILFFLMFSSFGFGQTREIDSLKDELKRSGLRDTTKVGIYMNLASRYMHVSNDSVYKYSDLALRDAGFLGPYFLGRANFHMGQYFSQDGQIDSAKVYLKTAVEIGEKSQDTTLIGLAYSGYKYVLSYDTDFEEKIEIGLKLIGLHQKNKSLLAEEQYNLAVTYSNGGFEDLAINYLEKAQRNAEKSGHEQLMSYILFSLTYFAIQEEKLDLAKKYLDKSLVICEKYKVLRYCTKYYLRAGLYYDKIGDLEQAKISYEEALRGSRELNDAYDEMFALVSLGEHFVTAKNPLEAIDNLKRFEAIKTDFPEPELEVRAYENFAKALQMTGDFKGANHYLESLILVKDSINTKKNKTFLANAETKYQSEKKDKEIAEQKLALTESKSKTRTMNILIVSLLLGSILLWFSFRQRQKRMQQQLVAIEREQEVRTLESLMEGEEKERLRIAKELHDGVNGDLAAIKFKLTSLLETNNKVINEAVAMIDTSSEQVRAISHNLVPPSLRDFNLLEAVTTYCENMNAIHDPEISFQHLGNEIALDKKQEANLFRIIQELVTNSVKHAEAKEIHVQLSNVEDNLQLTVEDDGKGFDANNIESDGIGMQNVKSRVEYLNGLMDIKSDTKGTSFTITITDKPESA